MNQVLLIGNCGKDPEVRTTQGGDAVASFSLATSQRWNDRNGEKKEETTWHQITAWKRLAEIAGQYVTKGSKVAIRGRIKTEKWTDRQSGQERSRQIIVAEEIELLGDRQRDGEERPKSGYHAAQAREQQPADTYPNGDPFDDGDIPFSLLLGAPLAGTLLALLHFAGGVLA